MEVQVRGIIGAYLGCPLEMGDLVLSLSAAKSVYHIGE